MRHNEILGIRQNELFNYSNKDLFFRKTLLENVFDYSVIVIIMWNLSCFITKSSFSIPSEPLGRIAQGLSFLCDNVFFNQVYIILRKIILINFPRNIFVLNFLL